MSNHIVRDLHGNIITTLPHEPSASEVELIRAEKAKSEQEAGIGHITTIAMRAKLQIASVTQLETCEILAFQGVCKTGGYPEDGYDEDNTFARWSPSVGLNITITNPDLIGKFKAGQKYYIDFTKAD